MIDRFSGSFASVAIVITAASALISVPVTRISGPDTSFVAEDPWGDPDLQGIWTVETDTPFQRSPRFANQEFFTEAQREEFDRERAALRGRDNRGDRGSERDVAGAYNNAFGALKRTGTRTSLVVDPPNRQLLRQRRKLKRSPQPTAISAST